MKNNIKLNQQHKSSDRPIKPTTNNGNGATKIGNNSEKVVPNQSSGGGFLKIIIPAIILIAVLVLLMVLVFTLNMHCMFNGRIYRTTKYKRIRRENDYE